MASTSIDRLVCYRRPDDTALLPMSSPATIIAAEVGASTIVNAAFGFTFRFDGAGYSSADVCVNGFARLFGSVTSTDNTLLFAVNKFIVLAPWWDSLKTAYSNGYVRTEQQGAAPFRRFVVEWSVVHTSHDATNYDRLTFQLVIYETRDKFEFRFGPRIRVGSPAAYSASTGFKGDTDIVSTNFRDLWTDTLALGGNTTTPATALAGVDYDDLPTLAAEPNWPMCGRYVDVSVSEVSGIQDPYASPAWAIANNVNWLYCNHNPPAVAFAPWYPELTASSRYYVPVLAPSDHEAGSEVLVTMWAASTANVTLTIEPNVVPDPDPAINAHWDVGLYTQTVSTSGWTTWPVGTLTGWDDPVDQTHLRITVTGAGAVNCKLGSLVIKAVAQAEVPLGTRVSGFRPMGLAQFLQSGAAIHPEWYNRAWRNVALILGARTQMVWSSVWPSLATPSGGKLELLTASGVNQFRVIGVASASMVGWRGQSLTVRCSSEAGAATTTGTITLAEEAGTGCVLPVTTTLTTEVGSLDVLSDTPVLQAILQGGVADVAPLAVVATWAPSLSTGDLIPGVTPAPRLEYLVVLVDRIRRAARCYALTGYATFLSRAGSGTMDYVALQWLVPPATKALQPRVHRNAGKTAKVATALETSIFGASSGAGAADEILLAAPFSEGGDEYVPEGIIGLAQGAQVYEASPVAAMDRLLESPTATSWAGPVREVVSVMRGVGVGMVPVYPPTGSV